MNGRLLIDVVPTQILIPAEWRIGPHAELHIDVDHEIWVGDEHVSAANGFPVFGRYTFKRLTEPLYGITRAGIVEARFLTFDVS